MKTVKPLTAVSVALLIGACAPRESQLPTEGKQHSGSDAAADAAVVIDQQLAEHEPAANPGDSLPGRVDRERDGQLAVKADRDRSQQPAGKEQREIDGNKPGNSRQEAFAALTAMEDTASTPGLIAPAVRAKISNSEMTQGAILPSPAAARVDRENYLPYDENGVTLVSETPVSTFSIDVDTAGYANVRRMLAREGRLPPADAVRLEEMINYFSYQYQLPEAGQQPFSINTELAPAPWAEDRVLLQIGLKGYEPPAAQRPPANLVFLVDVSGSMRSPDKLGLVKKSLRLLVNRMSAEDRIALAVYAGSAGVVLESTGGDQKAKILTAIDGLQAGGSTHGSAGIELAYLLAEQHQIEGGINRVLIASDGDMNVGTVNIEALKNLIERKRESGIALTTLGFGSGNYNYALMEQLADVGNGNAAYIDSLKEAQKVLVNEMQSTLLTIASDVKIQVEFNPAMVSEYRLLGYENRLLKREDFVNDKVDAGEIGAGHTVTALYELVLADSGGDRIPALRYANATQDREAVMQVGELGYVKLRYKKPGATASQELGRPIKADSIRSDLDEGSDDLRFATSVAGFGQLLQGGQHLGAWNYTQALELARASRGSDPHGYRSEFVHLVELARSLSAGS